jgi:Ran GTPase-activating protein (RanGAP) involved in mRNA processing and transport
MILYHQTKLYLKSNIALVSLSIVAALKSNRALRELYLSNNNLNSEQDSMQLGDLLRYNSSITTLDLSNNTIANSGALKEHILYETDTTVPVEAAGGRTAYNNGWN